MTWPPTQHLAVLIVALVAAAMDLKERRIPNALTIGAAGLGVAMHLVLNGWRGGAFALSGWALGVVIFLPLFALKGMGAGDVKLLAAFGAWLGPQGVLWTALLAALAGGVLAVVVSLAKGYAGTGIRNLRLLLVAWLRGGIRPVGGITLSTSAGPRLPYAVPLAVGAMLTVWFR